jgi:hypothetical protein
METQVTYKTINDTTAVVVLEIFLRNATCHSFRMVIGDCIVISRLDRVGEQASMLFRTPEKVMEKFKKFGGIVCDVIAEARQKSKAQIKKAVTAS